MKQEVINGELAGKIGDQVNNLILEHISEISSDIEKLLKEKNDGKDAVIPVTVKISLQSPNNRQFFWDTAIEWQRAKKSKFEAVQESYDPDQEELPFEVEPEKVKIGKAEK